MAKDNYGVDLGHTCRFCLGNPPYGDTLVQQARDDLHRAEAAEKALREIADAKPIWSDDGSYAGGETYYHFAERLQGMATTAVSGPANGPEKQS